MFGIHFAEAVLRKIKVRIALKIKNDIYFGINNFIRCGIKKF